MLVWQTLCFLFLLYYLITSIRLDSITDSMDMSLSQLWEMVKDREAWHVAVHGVSKSQTQLSDWTELNWIHPSKL